MPLPPDPLARVTRDDAISILRAAALLAIVDAVCALAINAVFFDQKSFAATFQGIAFSVMGRSAFAGGVWTVIVGLAIHCAVAGFWVSSYALMYGNSRAVRRFAAGPVGIIRAGALLGALIWLAMNFVVFPLTPIHAYAVTSAKFQILLVQHIVVVGPLVVASLR